MLVLTSILISYDSKDTFKKCTLSYVLSPVLRTVLCTHHDVTDLEIQGMVKNLSISKAEHSFSTKQRNS